MRRAGIRPHQVFVGLFIILLALVLSSFGLVRAGNVALPVIPADQVVVKLRPGISVNTILARYNATLLETITESNLYFLQLATGETAEHLLPTLNADTSLFYAEPNYYADGGPGAGGAIMFGAHMAPLAEGAIMFGAHMDPLTQGAIMFGAHGEPPLEPPTSDQWAWSTVGLSDAQKISRGQGIIIAILDTGLAPDHLFLNSNITAGYNFVSMNNEIYDWGNGIDDDNNGITDEFVGHGTHVAGILVTEAPGIQIMPIRVLNSEGVGTYWEVAAGIKYAVDHGANIINMSMSAPRLTPSLKDALDYASSHGVIVISAAGTGAGPNYPAAYSNSLSLGVGATDENNAIPWFSGGQIADTDIYAPGTNIYSAYPYNGYGLASGTSMSAPVVSGEVALLMSRYPEWSPAQVVQRIINKTDPLTGSEVGRVNLSKALNTGVEAYYSVGDFNSPNDNSLKPHIRLINNTPQNIPLNELKVRYWYSADSNQPQVFNCDYATINCGNMTSSFIHLSGNNSASDTYLEVGFSTSASALAAGGLVDMYLRVNQANWTDYMETNDYSYDETKAVATRWDHITIYQNGNLIWGIEPSNGQGSATSTSTTQAAMQTAVLYTNTLAWTATATRTATPMPSATIAKTATVLPSTSTATAATSGTVKVQYMSGNMSANSQSISPQLILVNSGTTSVPLNELKLRYWFTIDGNQPQTYWCDYAALGCSNISTQFVGLQNARPSADYYLEMSFNSGAGSLGAGANSGQIQSRFSKNDWSFYVQSGDYSFDPSKTQFSDWNRVTLYRNGTLIWGIEP